MMPDGTGGFYDAVLNDKLLADWDFWGIKYVHVMGTDNMLGRPVDPTLIGMLRGIDGETSLDFVTKAVEVTANDVNLY
jgi:UDP-N-acetylglucosamine pyrophosphorylase